MTTVAEHTSRLITIWATASESGLRACLDGIAELYNESESRVLQDDYRRQYEACEAIGRLRFDWSKNPLR
jgi:hypothetical protein